MRKPVLYRYQVDEVPIIIRLQFYIYGYGLGLLLFILLLILRLTTKVKISGHENLKKNSNHIFCLWHSFVPLALVSATPLIPKFLDRAPQAWMQHPIWYMKPIHVLLRLMGVKKIIMGSTGHSGREAAEQLLDHLRQGCSTVLNPDGPHGPAFVLKKGILHLSLESRVPVVVLRFSSSNFSELRTWDRKKLSYPFSTVEMEIGEPIHVTKENFAYAHDLIERKLGDFRNAI
ncbi:MAG: DUF374 domain-containing protein [Candidatus Margulisbacteria bacterium]|nr:DUF374 domain-containing protein [Candidatus Margulisiibacteriota bacterium]